MVFIIKTELKRAFGTSLFFIACIKSIPTLLSNWPTFSLVFLWLPFLKAFPAAFIIPCQNQLQIVLTSKPHICKLSTSDFLYVLLHSVFSCVWALSESHLPFHPCTSLGIFAWQPLYWDGLSFCLEEVILKDHSAFLKPHFALGLYALRLFQVD